MYCLPITKSSPLLLLLPHFLRRIVQKKSVLYCRHTTLRQAVKEFFWNEDVNNPYFLKPQLSPLYYAAQFPCKRLERAERSIIGDRFELIVLVDGEKTRT